MVYICVGYGGAARQFTSSVAEKLDTLITRSRRSGYRNVAPFVSNFYPIVENWFSGPPISPLSGMIISSAPPSGSMMPKASLPKK